MSFSSEVAGFHKEVMQAVLAVFQTSIQLMAEWIVDNQPVDTGFLRNSFMITTNYLPNVGDVGMGAAGISAALAGVKITDTVYLSFTAAYAMRVEYGFENVDALGRAFNQSGHFIVRNAAQDWKFFVEDAFKQAGAVS
ncbi:hypothetical protein ACLBWZ_08910 [Brucellaceae bacterium C25G]